MARRKRMKLPNGFGTIEKMQGRRRKPYRARKQIENIFGETERKTIGYGSTYEEAFNILVDYNRDPYDIDTKNMSFEDLYNRFLKFKLEEVEQKKLSEKSIVRYKNAFRYYSPIKHLSFVDIKRYQLENIINDCEHSYYIKSDIKTLYNSIYDLAISYDLPVKRNMFEGIDIGKKEKSTKHKDISAEDIKKLWNNKDKDWVGAILIQIYAGLRPTELLTIKEIHLEERYMIGGIKTKNGIDRTIPINEKIVPLVENYLMSGKLNISYSTYSKYFKIGLENAGINKTKYSPHDCRHTCATMLDNVDANEVCVKLILGHTIQDLTKGTYTHKTTQQLIDTINLI